MMPEAIEIALEVFAENQRNYFANIGLQDEIIGGAMKMKFGSDFIERICDAIKAGGRKSVLFEIAGVQPFTQPVGLIYYRQHCGGLGNAGTAAMISKSVVAETRKLKAGFVLEMTPLDVFTREVFKEEETNCELEKCFSDAWSEIEQEVLGTIYNAVDTVNERAIEISKTDVVNDIYRLVNSVRDKQCGPADAVLVSDITFAQLKQDSVFASRTVEGPTRSGACNWPLRVARLDSRITIYIDDYFPEKKLLAFRKARDAFDHTIIWSPYLFAGGGITSDSRHYMSLRVRGKITLLSRDFIAQGEIQ